MNHTLRLCVSIIAISSMYAHGVDNPHFYRAANMFLEPRLEHDYLTTFDVTLGGGSTKKGRDRQDNFVPLYDIYGTNNIQQLGLALENPNPNNPYDQILIDLAMLPTRTDFATLSIGATFNIIESNLSFTQNLAKGFLVFFHLPVRRLNVHDVIFTDLSPDDTIVPNKNSIEWQRFLQFFTPTLANFGLNVSPTISTSVGDLTAWLGWTNNYQETTTIDFIDSTLMAGFLAPTGKKQNINELFSLPTGYNGHWGFPLCAMFSLGFYEWITMGAYVNGLFFLNRDATMRLKTSMNETGVIKLVTGDVSVHRGPLVHTGLYLKADHCAYGFSFTAAYSFASQAHDRLTPKNPTQFDTTIINSDSTLRGWNMHTVNFLAEYDFTKEDSKIGNRIGFFYNLQVAGKQTWNTGVGGGSYGIDIGWNM